MDDDDFNILKEYLVEDFYLWDEIVDMYLKISQKPKVNAINALTLKKLGFKVYSRYVINAEYPSADAYFTRLLLKDKCIDLAEMKQGVRSIQSFGSALNTLRDSLEIIEVKQDVFYRYDLFADTYSIESKEYLIKLGNMILSGLIADEYFSVDVVATKILEAEHIPAICKNVYILNSIIRAQPEYKTCKIANTYLATKKENELSQAGLVKYIVAKNDDISITLLIDTLKKQYNLDLDKSRIIYLIQGSEELFYDDIFDYVISQDKYILNDDPVFLNNSRFAEEIERKLELINISKMSIAKYYWQEKYSGFVEFCGMNDWFLMKDILKLDFRNLSENASKLGISKGSIADIVNAYMDWVKSLSESKTEDVDDVNILDLFFK